MSDDKLPDRLMCEKAFSEEVARLIGIFPPNGTTPNFANGFHIGLKIGRAEKNVIMTDSHSKHEISSIYDGIEKLPISVDLQGWNSDGPIFASVIADTKPSVIVEVGTWKGASAIHMAKLTRAMGLDTIIYCVDCWMPPIGVGLGEYPKTHIPPRYDAPGIYEQFLFNVKAAGCDDRIIPVRGLTRCIAGLLQHWGVSAQVIYIDASHDEESVYGDLVAFWPIVSAGGIMCGDDYGGHEGVRRAVNRFANVHQKEVRIFPAQECTQWAFDPK